MSTKEISAPRPADVAAEGRLVRRFAWMTAAAVLLSAGCDVGGVTDAAAGVTAAQVAFVVQEGGRPALYVQGADGSGHTRIHFAGAQELPGNPDLFPPVRDENILALGPLAWSPDGRLLAVVVTLAYDQSEVVVVKADGTDARVASLNTQSVMTIPEWSPDGTKLAYGMSTLARGGAVQLFVTDLAANSWRQLTHGDPVGSAGTNLRWSGDGAKIYLWRTIGQTPASTDWVSRISVVDATTGSAVVLADSVAGMVQDVARNGTWSLILRTSAEPAGLDGVRVLLRRPLFGRGPELKLLEGDLWWARASEDDRAVTVLVDADSSRTLDKLGASVLPSGGGKAVPIPGLDGGAYMLDVLFR